MRAPVSDLSDAEAVFIARCRERALSQGVSVAEILSPLFALLPDVRAAETTVHEAVLDHLDWMRARGCRPSTIASQHQALTAYAASRTGVGIASETPSDISAYICARYAAESSRRTLKSRLGLFFKWAEREGLVKRNFMGGVHWNAAKEDARAIRFWRADTVARFMSAVQENLRAAFALAFFAGIRPEELSGMPGPGVDFLRWADIDFDRKTVVIRAEVAKTRKERKLFDLPDNLWLWLEAYRGFAGGRVADMNRRNFAAARRRACASIGVKWPHDCARHSFASHAYWRGYEWTAAMLGHESGPRIFFAHYKGTTTKDDAEAYNQVKP